MNTLLLKIPVFGDYNVGKTRLLEGLKKGTFERDAVKPRTTINIDLIEKKYQWNNNEVVLQLWDTAGTERFHASNFGVLRGARAIILVYDITSISSFHRLSSYWLPKINDILVDARNDPVPVFLIGNKLDLDAERRVSLINANKFKNQQAFHGFYETSAFLGSGVSQAFQHIVAVLTAHYDFKPPPRGSIRLSAVDREISKANNRKCRILC